MEINAAVFRKVHEPLTIEAVDIDKPWGREVLVRTAATGVCHSDLHVVDGQGRFPLDRPIVLGHEGAGVVEAVGTEVTAVKPGDHIVACLSGFCGNCPQCLAGHPNLCTGGIVTRPEGAAPRLSQDGRPLRQFIGISSYAEKMLLHENSLVKIDRELPLDNRTPAEKFLESPPHQRPPAKSRRRFLPNGQTVHRGVIAPLIGKFQDRHAIPAGCRRSGRVVRDRRHRRRLSALHRGRRSAA